MALVGLGTRVPTASQFGISVFTKVEGLRGRSGIRVRTSVERGGQILTAEQLGEDATEAVVNVRGCVETETRMELLPHQTEYHIEALKERVGAGRHWQEVGNSQS